MKILFFTDSLRSGGKERRIGELIKGLMQKGGYEIEVATMDYDVHYKIFYDLNIKIHFLVRKWRWDPNIFLKLYKLCKNFKPDIVHVWDLMSSVYASPIVKLLKLKFINGMITIAPAKIKIFSRNWLYSRISSPFSDIILANSNAGLQSFKVPDYKSRYIHNGFDFARIKNLKEPTDIREKYGIGNGKVVGMVASFTNHKDYLTFIKSALNLMNKRNDVCFVTVGDGPNIDKAKQMIPEIYLEKFKFLGRIDDVESIVNTFYIGVLTTNNKIVGEGISNSIMEYMALEKPVIATDSGGNKEIVINNETGFLIEPYNVHYLEEKMNFLLDNPSIAQNMGIRGKNRIFNHFSLERMVNEFIEVYKNVLK